MIEGGGESPAFDARIVPARYVTDSLQGLGGRIKERPEDFLVEEIPLYEPVGEGEHVYLFVEKRGLSTLHLVRLIARHFGVRPDAVGYAGLKDKHAVTRQMISVHLPGRSVDEFGPIEHRGVQVLWIDRHANKLRSGHLRANRFSIRIRGVSPTGVTTAKRALDMLAAHGTPNRFGEQRFGQGGINHLIGRAIILGRHDDVVRLLLSPVEVAVRRSLESDDDEADDANSMLKGNRARQFFAEGRLDEALAALPNSARTERRVLTWLIRTGNVRRAAGAIDRQERSYFITAFQSAVFNAVLDARLLARTADVLLPGDVAFKHATGGVFDVTEATLAEADTASRLEAIEISPSGPMWGSAMKRASGECDRVELAALRGAGLDPDVVAERAPTCRPWLEGARRPLRTPIRDVDVEGGIDEHGAYVRCAFELPRGGFATSVLREIMKPETVSGA